MTLGTYSHTPGYPGVVLDAFDSYYAKRGLDALPQWAQDQLPKLPKPKEVVKREATAAAKQAGNVALNKLEQGIGVPIPKSGRAAKKLAQKEAEKLGKKAIKEMGLPPIPLSIPSNILTPEGVKDVAYAAGKTYVEDAIKAEFGVPISLPDKLTAKAIMRSVGSIVPTDVEGAIDLGLTIGTQAAASAVTSLLVGAGVGSVIPGLGTLVGIGAALGVAALKETFKPATPKHLRKCKTKVTCPSPPASMSPMEMLPWLANTDIFISTQIAQEQAKKMCGTGPAVECAAYMGTLAARVYRMSEKTPEVLGLMQLNTLIPAYQESVKKRGLYYDKKRRQLVPGGSVAQQKMNLLLPKMIKRRTQLQELVAKGQRISTLSAGQVASLRFTLPTELTRAAVQYQFAPGPETQGWLRMLAGFMTQVRGAEERRAAERKATFVKHTKRTAEIKADPALKRKHDLDILQFRCGQGDERACVEHRRLSKAPLAPAPAPAPAPRTPPVVPVPLKQRCRDMLAKWGSDNRAKFRCLNAAERNRMLDICMQTFGTKTITPQVAQARLDAIVAQACARQRAPALVPTGVPKMDFRKTPVVPAQPPRPAPRPPVPPRPPAGPPVRLTPSQQRVAARMSPARRAGYIRAIQRFRQRR